MPPLKTYTFENVKNNNTLISIRAYKEDQAFRILEETVKKPKDFKIIP